MTTNNNSYSSTPDILQNYLLVWVDASIDRSKKECQDTLEQLCTLVNTVNLFTTVDACVHFLQNIDRQKVFVITSGSLGQDLVPRIHSMVWLDGICIFCTNPDRHVSWASDWTKIQGVFTEVEKICEALQESAMLHDQSTIPMGFVALNENDSHIDLNQLEPSFMYTQLFKEILMAMKYDEQAPRELLKYCHKKKVNLHDRIAVINEFQNKYDANKAIWWYTRECFIYRMLNQALRQLEADIIVHMGFFIHDLHRQIEHLHKSQIKSYRGAPFLLYRGQGLSEVAFVKIKETQGGLLSFNNFLSTSKSKATSLGFMHRSSRNVNTVRVLFVMTINPEISSIPFATVDRISCFQLEAEILFSMHCVFRIDQVNDMGTLQDPYHEVQLTLTADSDPRLCRLTEHIGKELEGSTGLERVGQLLIRVGQLSKAEELYVTLFEQASDSNDRAQCNHQIGYIQSQQGNYKGALSNYGKALEFYRKTLREDHPTLAMCYNNIGGVHDSMRQHADALLFYERALAIRLKSLSRNHPDVATSYNNIGGVHESKGEYAKALSYYVKGLHTKQETAPENHPSLATSYNNIGGVHHKMGDHVKALSFYQKALAILEETLPANHPSFAASYNNIGGIHNKLGDHAKALSFYEKAQPILQKSLAENHPFLATSHNNMGMAYNKLGQADKALFHYGRALEIRRKSLTANHPDLASSYNNIGGVHNSTGEHSKALSHYEQALAILRKNPTESQLPLATTYNNIGTVHNNKAEYSKALEFYEKALVLFEKMLQANHPTLATSYSNIGTVHHSMGNPSEALSFFERALKMRQSVLSDSHPDVREIVEWIEIVKRRA